jgi:putative nucleotidyltransferase with HDIG domain
MNTANTAKDNTEIVEQAIHHAHLRTLNPAKRYLDGVTSLPPSPILVTKLLTLFRNPGHDLDQVVQLIGYEPSLTAQLLRTCNSACFAGEEPTGDIFDAITRIGLYQIYCLVVAIYGAKAKSMPGADRGVDVKELWRHSVAVAVAASVVAEAAGQAKVEAFTGGLLHDIGKLVLASTEGEAYARIIERARDEEVSLIALERGTFVIDHAELGGELMRRWDLPPDIVATVRYHHDVAAAPPFERLTATVHIGDLISHQLCAQDLVSRHVLTPSAVALDVLQISHDALPRLLAKTESEMENVKAMLEI